MSPAETKELEDLKQSIIERKAILKEQGFSGGQQNKDEEIATGYWFHLLFRGEDHFNGFFRFGLFSYLCGM